MKTCPVCQRNFEDSVAFCPEKHGSLIAARVSFPRTIGQYRLGTPIADGAAGTIYQATHAGLEQSFAVKIIGAEAAGATEIEREKLFAEARLAAGIFHPNVARVYESGWLDDGDFYVVSERVAGQTLDAHLRAVGALSEIEAVAIAGQTAQALEAAHRAGVIHRAVNPANIILGTDSENRRSIKLMNFDFGAVDERLAADEFSRPQSPSAAAARRYLSPEQRARETADARADIFSLGSLLYAMLCGRAPVSPAAGDDRRFNEQPLVHLRYDVRALLTYLLKQSLQPSAATRLSSAANFARQLRQVEQLIAPPVGMPRAAPQPFAPKKAESGEAAVSAETSAPESPAPETIQPPNENYRTAKSDVDKDAAAITPPTINQLDILAPAETTAASPLGSLVSPGGATAAEPSKTQKSDDDLSSAREPNLIEKQESSLPLFVSLPILVKKKQSDSPAPTAIPAAAEAPDENASEPSAVVRNAEVVRITDAKPAGFPAVNQNTAVYQQPQRAAPIVRADDEPRTRPRKALAARRSQRLVGAALIALVVIAAGLGMFLYSRLNRPLAAEQAAVNETPVAADPTVSPSAGADDNAALTAAPETSETGDFAALKASEKPSSINPNNPKTETQTQPRRKIPANNEVATNDSSADQPAADNQSDETVSRERSGTGNEQTELNSSLDQWISATNDRDVERQMNYYAPKVNAYYRARNASPELVRAEKKRIFERANAVDIQTGKPEITVSRDGRNATMRFRKKYAIKEGPKNRSGEVIQELRWIKSGNDWKIVSERDVKVIKP